MSADTFRHFRLRFNPESKLIKVDEADGTIAHPAAIVGPSQISPSEYRL
jgi:hypothetical protein